jgi:hypothetical protein
MSMQQPSVSTPATTSRAVRLESFGGPEVLNLREVPQIRAAVELQASRHVHGKVVIDL